jgi:S-adenosylmethionine decarboxylase
MRDLAPSIVRQRLLIEGIVGIDVDAEVIRGYFTAITEALRLRTYGEPIVHSPGGEGKDENQGYDAFIPLIDSGIALYVWSKARFASAVLYTCKRFDRQVAVDVTKRYFAMLDVEAEDF